MPKRIQHLCAAITVCLVFLASVPPRPVQAAAICYANAAASPPGTGASWGTAYAALSSALGNVACTEIWVASGVYYPGGARTNTFNVLPGVEVYGGFAGTESARAQRNPAANVTVLSGDIDKNDTNTDGNNIDETSLDIQGGNSYHVVTMNGTATKILADTVLDGLIITGGLANGASASGYNSGAGLFCNGGGATHECSPTLNNLTFSGNKAFRGGGIYNRAVSGGASSPTLTNVTFSHVWADNQGGAMANIATGAGAISSPTLENVTFSHNGSGYYGGAVYNNATDGGVSSPEFTNVTFSNNQATHFGGAMYNDAWGYTSGTSVPSLRNVILWDDFADEAGNEIYNDEGAQTAIARSIIEGGCASIPDALCGTGNLATDPKLGNLADNGGFTKTMALLPGSSAIDTGYAALCPAADERGVPRPQGTQCDKGAVEKEPSLTFRSLGSQDGWLLESDETSGLAGSSDAVDIQFNLGDDALNRQYRAILSFNTGPSLPDTAVIVTATLRLKKTGLVGADPFTSLGSLAMDVRQGGFSGNSALQLTDFYAAGTKNYAGSIGSVPAGVWYSGSVKPGYLQYLSPSSGNQIRLRFATDDNNNSVANYLRFASGNAITTSRPQLIITYYVP